MRKKRICLLAIAIFGFSFLSCSDDKSGTEADRVGIAGECSASEDCAQDVDSLQCLTGFKGGYCGLAGCTENANCPIGSVCVLENGSSFCFRTCADKNECNPNRSAANEANCSGSFDLMKADDQMPVGLAKVCIPPSAGD